MRLLRSLRGAGPATVLFLLLAAAPAPAAKTAGTGGHAPAPAPGTDRAAVQDIRDIKGPLESGSDLPVLAVCTGLILAGGGMLFFILRRRRRTASAAAPSAGRQALARLAQIQTLMADDRPDEFAAGLADILRFYLESRFHLPARNRTSREFVRSLADGPGAPPLLQDHLDRLRQWLHLCDMAKFARSPLSRQQMEAMLDAVRDFVVATDVEPPAADTTATEKPPENDRSEGQS